MKNPRPAREAGRGGCGSAGRHDHGPSSAFICDSAGDAGAATYTSSAGGLASPEDLEAWLRVHSEECPCCGALLLPLPATPDALSLTNTGEARAAQTHGSGGVWPGRLGELLAEVAVAVGGKTALRFETFEDALGFLRGLEAGSRP
jgi:hypothetical protein